MPVPSFAAADLRRRQALAGILAQPENSARRKSLRRAAVNLQRNNWRRSVCGKLDFPRDGRLEASGQRTCQSLRRLRRCGGMGRASAPLRAGRNAGCGARGARVAGQRAPSSSTISCRKSFSSCARGSGAFSGTSSRAERTPSWACCASFRCRWPTTISGASHSAKRGGKVVTVTWTMRSPPASDGSQADDAAGIQKAVLLSEIDARLRSAPEVIAERDRDHFLALLSAGTYGRGDCRVTQHGLIRQGRGERTAPRDSMAAQGDWNRRDRAAGPNRPEKPDSPGKESTAQIR